MTLSDEVKREVADELNVKALEQVESLAGLISWSVVPNFRALGPRLGKELGAIRIALANGEFEQLDGGRFRVAGPLMATPQVKSRRTSND